LLGVSLFAVSACSKNVSLPWSNVKSPFIFVVSVNALPKVVLPSTVRVPLAEILFVVDIAPLEVISPTSVILPELSTSNPPPPD
jgi:hypothetical protein